MQRKIKFRAWCKKRGMFNVDVLAINKTEWDCGTDNGVSIPYQPHISLMQFTGLHDKNGKEIYEGDIVKHERGVHPVTYLEECASFQMELSQSVLDQESSAGYDDVEVIGNVWENEDLLK